MNVYVWKVSLPSFLCLIKNFKRFFVIIVIKLVTVFVLIFVVFVCLLLLLLFFCDAVFITCATQSSYTLLKFAEINFT